MSAALQDFWDSVSNRWETSKKTTSSFATTANQAALRTIDVFEKIKNNPPALGRAASIVKYTFSHLPKLSKSFGSIEAVVDLFQVGGTLSAFSSNEKIKKYTWNALITELAFGVANVANAILWLRQQNLDVLAGVAFSLGKYATLDGLLTGGVLIGFTAVIKSKINTKAANSTDEEINKVKHHRLTCAWAASEIALIILPMMAITAPPTWGVIVAVKLVGLGSFLSDPDLWKSTKEKGG